MELYAIFDTNGKFLRAESVAARADRARSQGLRVLPLAVQGTADGFLGIAPEGELRISPGQRQWTPAGSTPQKGKDSKRIDKADADE
ncbi:MAG: hypothetical protein IPJ01_12070 [Micavibrio sp.]|nr:hypothetical protein [Micavibrio sp.]